MASNEFSVELVGVAGRLQPATVSVRIVSAAAVTVKLQSAGCELVMTAGDAFTAFAALRQRLIDFELTPRCFGACRNLVLSSMAYQMSRRTSRSRCNGPSRVPST